MKIYLTLLLLSLSSLCQAHYVWLEKTDNEARLYFGEWHNDLREGVEKLQRFSAAKIFIKQPSTTLDATIKDNFLQAKTKHSGDIRMLLDTLPTKENRKGVIRKTYYYAKSGRSDLSPQLTLELVPTQANGDDYQLLFNNRPLANQEVTVYGPPKWEKHLKTDKEGKLSFNTPWAGTYLIRISHTIPSTLTRPTLDAPNVRHIYTGTITVKNGINWL